MQNIVKIRLREINISRSRPLLNHFVKSLAASMAEIGLLNPIIVKRGVIYDGNVMADGYRVIAGDHRVSAAIQLGWDDIDAFLYDGDELKAELTQIDENLLRAELTSAQRAAAIKRRKNVWDAMQTALESGTICSTLLPKTGRGNTQFAAETAKATGVAKQSINRHIARAEALGDEINELVGTSLDKGVELDALAEMDAGDRRELIDKAKSGEDVSARKRVEYTPDAKDDDGEEDYYQPNLKWIARIRRLISSLEKYANSMEAGVDTNLPALIKLENQLSKVYKDVFKENRHSENDILRAERERRANAA